MGIKPRKHTGIPKVMDSATLTIKCQLDGSDLRRRTVELPSSGLTLASLNSVVRELFQQSDTTTLKMVYTDEDGDDITIGCDADVAEAVRCATMSGKPMLRLRASSEVSAPTPTPHAPAPKPAAPASEPSARNQTAPDFGMFDMMRGFQQMASGFANQSQQTPSNTPRQGGFNMCDVMRGMQQVAPMVQQLQTEFEKHKPEIEKQVQHMATEFEKHRPEIEKQTKKAFEQMNTPEFKQHAPNLMKQMQQMFQGQCNTTAEANTAEATMPEAAVHYGIQCDVTGMNPIIGTRYKKNNEDYDLCQEAFNKLSEEEAQQFVHIDTPLQAAEIRQQEAQEEQALIADLLSSLGETHTTEVLEYALQQPETADVSPQAGLEHPGIWCDECNMKPIRGARYMRQMQLDTFDLCKGCYNALSESDQSEFKVIEPVEPAAAVHVEQAEATLKAAEEEAESAQKAAEDAKAAQKAAENAEAAQKAAEDAKAAQMAAEAEAVLKAEEAAAAEFARLAAVEEAKAEACRLAVERVAAKAAAEEAEAARVAAEEAEASRIAAEEAEASFAHLQKKLRIAAEEAEAARITAEAEAAARASKAKAVETAQGPVVPIEWQAAVDALVQMGFSESVAKVQVVATDGDLEAALEAALSFVPPPQPSWDSKWDSILEELVEMGFEDVEANKRFVMANDGDLKSIVTALVADERSKR